MTRVVFIKGSASPHTEEKIAEEAKILDNEVSVLRDAGFDVVEVGNVRDGFTPGDVERALKPSEVQPIIVAHAHGNVWKGQHHLWRRETKKKNGGYIPAIDFYKIIAATVQGPVNLFMHSCGAGNSAIQACDILPIGSTTVTMTNEDRLSSYFMDLGKFDMTGQENAAEGLFLNILCRDKEKAAHRPELYVSSNHGIFRYSKLWGDASSRLIADPDDTDTLKTQVLPLLQHLVDPEKIDETLVTMSMHALLNIRPAIESAHTSVRMPLAVDYDNFSRHLASAGLLGPTHAITYAVRRDQIGAFQTWPMERYSTTRRFGLN